MRNVCLGSKAGFILLVITTGTTGITGCASNTDFRDAHLNRAEIPEQGPNSPILILDQPLAIGRQHSCQFDGNGVFCIQSVLNPVSNAVRFKMNYIDAKYEKRMKRVHKISAGEYHTCILSNPDLHSGGRNKNGQVRCWGTSKYGQAGYLTSTSDKYIRTRPILTQDGELVSAKEISTGMRHSCAITDHEIYCWGDNSSAQLGVDPLQTGVNQSHLAYELSKVWNRQIRMVTAISVADEHSCAAIQFEGEDSPSAHCWGSNRFGQIGLPLDYETSADPIQLLTEEGEPIYAPSLIDAGGTVTLALASDERTIRCLGDTSDGICGLKDPNGIYEASPGIEFVDLAGLRIEIQKIHEITTGGKAACAVFTGRGQDDYRYNRALSCWGTNGRKFHNDEGPLLPFSRPKRKEDCFGYACYLKGQLVTTNESPVEWVRRVELKFGKGYLIVQRESLRRNAWFWGQRNETNILGKPTEGRLVRLTSPTQFLKTHTEQMSERKANNGRGRNRSATGSR